MRSKVMEVVVLILAGWLLGVMLFVLAGVPALMVVITRVAAEKWGWPWLWWVLAVVAGGLLAAPALMMERWMAVALVGLVCLILCVWWLGMEPWFVGLTILCGIISVVVWVLIIRSSKV